MVEINYKIFITGLICLTIIYIAILIAGTDGDMVLTLIAAFIGMATGIVIPAPKADNKGVLKW